MGEGESEAGRAFADGPAAGWVALDPVHVYPILLAEPFWVSRAELFGTRDQQGLTDRQIWEQYLLPAKRKAERERGERSVDDGPQCFGSPTTGKGGPDRYADPDPRMGGFEWKIPEASPDAVVEIDGKPIDAEALLDNFVRAGFLTPKQVEKARAEKRAMGGATDGATSQPE